jgi:predicted transcriptional regulator
MMMEGMKEEFDLVQTKGEEASQNKKEFKHAETEIEEHYLEKLEEDAPDDTEVLVHALLKEHAIDVLVRCNEEKRSALNLIWEEQTLQQLFAY